MLGDHRDRSRRRRVKIGQCGRRDGIGVAALQCKLRVGRLAITVKNIDSRKNFCEAFFLASITKANEVRWSSWRLVAVGDSPGNNMRQLRYRMLQNGLILFPQ